MGAMGSGSAGVGALGIPPGVLGPRGERGGRQGGFLLGVSEGGLGSKGFGEGSSFPRGFSWIVSLTCFFFIL